MVKIARCGCSGVCNCVIEGLATDCIIVTATGNGTPAIPYEISAIPVIDPVTGNQLSCGPSGLLVPAATDTSTTITVLDTNCIDMAITGVGSPGDPYVISAVPVVDPVTGNQLSCGVGGLFVPASGGGGGPTEDLAVFTRTGALTVGTGISRWFFPFAATLLGVSAGVGVAPTGSSIIIDVNKNGTTIFTTQANRPEIPISGFYSGVEDVPDVTAVVAGDYLTIDRDQVGSTLPGEELTVFIRYLRP